MTHCGGLEILFYSKSYFCYGDIAHQQPIFLEDGIRKQFLLTICVVMLKEHVDLVHGDFNGAAWRRPCGDDRKPSCIIGKVYTDTDLSMAPGPAPSSHCGKQVWGWAAAVMYAGFSSQQTQRELVLRHQGLFILPFATLGVVRITK